MSSTQFNIPLYLSLSLSHCPFLLQSRICCLSLLFFLSFSIYHSITFTLVYSSLFQTISFKHPFKSGPKDFVFYFHPQFFSQKQVSFNSLHWISTAMFVISFTFNLSFSIVSQTYKVFNFNTVYMYTITDRVFFPV